MKLIYPAEFKMRNRSLRTDKTYKFGNLTGNIYDAAFPVNRSFPYEKNPNDNDKSLGIFVNTLKLKPEIV